METQPTAMDSRTGNTDRRVRNAARAVARAIRPFSLSVTAPYGIAGENWPKFGPMGALPIQAVALKLGAELTPHRERRLTQRQTVQAVPMAGKTAGAIEEARQAGSTPEA